MSRSLTCVNLLGRSPADPMPFQSARGNRYESFLQRFTPAGLEGWADIAESRLYGAVRGVGMAAISASPQAA